MSVWYSDAHEINPGHELMLIINGRLGEMGGLEIIVFLVLLYFVIRNAVEDGINRSVLGESKMKEDDNDSIVD